MFTIGLSYNFPSIVFKNDMNELELYRRGNVDGKQFGKIVYGETR